MSYLIKITNGEIDFYYNERLTPAPTKLFMQEGIIDIIAGEIYEDENKVIERHIWWGNPEKLLSIEGMFSVISIDKSNRKIYFSTDKIGTEHLYYYDNNSTFYISDSFWDIVSGMDINYEDLDIETIKENCIGWIFPDMGRTIIKNLKILSPGTYNEFDCVEMKKNTKAYWKFCREKDKTKDISAAVQGLDKALNKTLKKIQENVGNVRYATGISGGMDSRIIPYYSICNGMDINGFILGCKRPRKVFLSKDHKNARAITKIVNIKQKEIPWNFKTFEEKVEKEIMLAPMVTPQFYKYEEFFDFDCLLTGASGSIVGGDFDNRLIGANNFNEMVKILFDLRSIFGWDFEKINRRRVSKAIKYLFNFDLKRNTEEPDWHKKLFNSSMKESLIEQTRRYVQDLYDKGLDNTDIYMDYFVQEITYRNRLGAYESFLGQKRSFSIYMPYVYEEVLKWNESFFDKRLVLKELIRTKIKELSDIGAQNYLLAPAEKNNFLNKAKGIISYVLRGGGTTTDEIYSKKKNIRKYYMTKLENSKWYRSVFDELNDRDIELMIKDDNKIATFHLKHCIILDKLETGEYRDFKIEKYDTVEKI